VLILLSVIILTIQSSPNVYEFPRPTSAYFHGWEDYALFAIFCAFTAEILARIVVTGLIRNPPLPAGSPAGTGTTPPVESLRSPQLQSPATGTPPAPGALDSLSRRVRAKLPGGGGVASYPPTARDLAVSTSTYASVRANASTASLTRTRDASSSATASAAAGIGLGLAAGPISLRPALSSSYATKGSTPFVLSIQKQRATYQQAFLRHSWNRVDLVAVVSFWVCFVVASLGYEASENLYIFRALSVLRATRLLAVTAGTSVSLVSLLRPSGDLLTSPRRRSFNLSSEPRRSWSTSRCSWCSPCPCSGVPWLSRWHRSR
jgi:hypothetical protein